jgi:hypothetical protein
MNAQAEEVLNRLRVFAVAYQVGEFISADRLIQAGLNALLNDIDTPSIRRLAGLARREESESHDLFAQVIAELELMPPVEGDLMADTADGIRWQLVRSWARQIVDGDLAPEFGGNLIWYEGWERLGHPAVLQPIVGATSEYEDQPVSAWNDRSDYADRIVDAARDFLSAGIA